MTKITRRGLLGAAATGTLSVAACATPAPAAPKTAPYAGEVEFLHGVASGDPLPDRVILWTRVTPKSGTGPIPVTYEVMDPADPAAPILTGTATASESRDFCVKVDVTGLKPGTAYLYKFKVATEAGEIVSREGRTKTTSATGSAPVRMGVVSCSNWQFGFFNAYEALSREEDLDVIIHLGDYFYEYGVDGYGGDVATSIGREHDPVTEVVTLADYRMRHAQYKTDPNLQAAHAKAPWICTWDDHESTNNSYRTGAQNHNPEDGEGDWTDRKQAAIQAYFEWQPLREPAAGNITSAVWRSFTFGDVATIHALESRLTGRSPDVSWFDALAGVTDQEVMQQRVAETLRTIRDPSRTMLGAEQEAWLAGELKSSVEKGKSWQVLANQVVMASTTLPNFQKTLTPEQLAAQDNGFVKTLLGFSTLGLPFNLDAWDGFPAARERLYAGAAAANAKLVTLAGDTHTAWVNTLQDANGEQRGVEFGCTSITSPGSGAYIKDIPDLGEQVMAANEDVVWHDPFSRGYTIVTLTPEAARAEYRTVSNILSHDYTVETVAVYETRQQDGKLTDLASLS
ncbi:alkaline phosphatase D family protein [Hyphomonas sp.]|uniref:alkaline phosphatase D family protein n=1 Tax=Hyphomonas sp. TaxID=87 RepID=UPI0025B9C134|nr:alkaline phosphatase D family protein [Hyphomonas sp.]